MTATGLIGAIDQGTTSTRFMIIDHDGRVRGRGQLPHDQLLPRPGWVEHDAEQIWARTRSVIEEGLADAGCTAADLAAVGVTNQRETTVLWHRGTGRPYGPAIVWQDLRTAELINRLTADGHAELIRERTGLPPATYFAGGKIAWLLDHVEGARRDAEAGDALAGTIDTWLLWNLTGGPDGGVHVTDTTNASRTMLMDLRTGQWDPQLLSLFDIPRAVLPSIRPSTAATGFGAIGPQSPLAGVPITAVLGDQHAALIGHRCFGPGAAKATFGTGTFVLLATGSEPVRSSHGLLTTVGYHFDGAPPMYALEGSVAVAGSAVQWLRDQLGVITETAEIEPLAAGVDDTGGVYFVPAFSGLFAPYWRSDARGTIVGLTRYSTKAHLARATLEAIGYATRDVIDAMQRDSGITLDELRVDGGISENDLCMQLQADILGVPVRRPAIAETTALGAAYAAGLAIGYWSGPDELPTHARHERRWQPQWDEAQRRIGYAQWHKAVQRSTGWVETDWVETD